jgi:hypothetical protein
VQEYGATAYGVGPPSLWPAAEQAAARAGEAEQAEAEAEAEEVLTSLRGEGDELHEGVVLPDAADARHEWEAAQAAQRQAYTDEKVANREIRVWHGATGTGP